MSNAAVRAVMLMDNLEGVDRKANAGSQHYLMGLLYCIVIVILKFTSNDFTLAMFLKGSLALDLETFSYGPVQASDLLE